VIQRWLFVHNQIATGTTAEIIAFLKERNINFIVLLYKTRLHYHANYTTPTALVVGTEATGLTEVA
jgi:TrmH family RNA methyltransferase